MATLEKIRSKSVLLIVIIGVALLAFIIGDFFTSGRTFFGTGTTVAKVDGEKIDITDLQRRVEEFNQQQQQQKTDGAELQQNALDDLITERLFNKELDRLGITVTDAELSDAMIGRGAQMTSDRIARQTQGQFGSSIQLHNMITKPADFGLTPDQVAPLAQYWRQLENEMEQQLKQQKFLMLFNGALVANKLDAKALYDENATPRRMAYVKADYTTLPDEEYQPTDAELNKEWGANKESYRLPEQIRCIDYISVAIVPSPEDIIAGQQRVEEALAALREGTDASALSSMTDFVVNNQRSVVSKINNRTISSFIDTAKTGEAAIVSRNANAYTLAKLISRNNETDSVNIDYLVVSGRAQADSLMNALASGNTTFADAAKNSNVAESQDSMWITLTSPEMSQMRSIFTDHATGTYFTPDTAANAAAVRIFRINNRRAAVPVVEYAEVTYSIDPSEATVNKLEADLANYLAENTDAAKFAQNAIEAGYQVMNAKISPSTAKINGMNDTRSAIVWALDAKKGNVSQIFGNEQTGRYLAVALTDVYDDYIPVRDPQVKDYLTTRVINQKKGAALEEKYAGKANSLTEYATLMSGQVDTTNVYFGQAFVPNIGMNEAELQARASIAKEGVNETVKGNNALVIFEIIGEENASRPYNFEESAQQYSGMRGAYRLGNALNMILRSDKKVKNNLNKFYTN